MCDEQRIAGNRDGRYLKLEFAVTQAVKQCFLFANNKLYVSVSALIEV